MTPPDSSSLVSRECNQCHAWKSTSSSKVAHQREEFCHPQEDPKMLFRPKSNEHVIH